jgi:V/A-type H+-transporting ATPase subunit K
MEKAIVIGFLAMAAAVAVAGAALATGLAQGRIGSAGAGTVAEKPELLGGMIVMLAIPETMVILGFAVAAMLILRMG